MFFDIGSQKFPFLGGRKGGGHTPKGPLICNVTVYPKSTFCHPLDYFWKASHLCTITYKHLVKYDSWISILMLASQIIQKWDSLVPGHAACHLTAIYGGTCLGLQIQPCLMCEIHPHALNWSADWLPMWECMGSLCWHRGHDSPKRKEGERKKERII